MHLETDRMILRDFTIKDLGDFHEIFGDAEVMKHLEPPYDMKEARKFLVRFCIKRKPKGAFAAVQKETGKVIGYLLFKSIDEPEIYEIAWIFNKSYWRHGYAYEICSRLISHGFEEMKLHKICAETEDDVKSVPFMKKLGMQLDGVHRKHMKSIDGEWRDLHWYGILADDYFGGKNAGKQQPSGLFPPIQRQLP